MNLFTEWITRIVLFLLLAMVSDALLPSGTMKKYARLVMSILLLLIFLGPLLQILKVDPNQFIHQAEQAMKEQVNDEDLNEAIESKKNEILEGQDAYKLEQIEQAVSKEISKPLEEEMNLKLTDVSMTFDGEPYELNTLDKLIVTLSPFKEQNTVDEVTISIDGDAPEKKDTNRNEEVVGWLTKQLDLDKDQIAIRWEEEDE
ncbi:stage III sporulation protein AF [Halobacillus salinarum]|uniref:Stage III sporulation protein AF n=1 Tax=Halobacillus salinarum TaxID=2932257 RepID=A0ABY4EGK0_9BACI|nr:stage III sporulation protein AF [Halobacillus salinarum]UOQ42557.1 stage III sporulation protein AF [Halobacillus salinarum]